jgi:DNA-binding GntR family transcriptional regulator
MVETGKKTNLYEQVYQSIKSSIIQGIYQPGEKLKEIRLAQQLNTSRTPVREALRKLEKEGLVIFYPSQGAEVTPLDEEIITHLYKCRSVLEALAAHQAALTIQLDDLKILEESIILANQYLTSGNLGRVIEKNTLFHDTILLASNNQPLIHLMEQIRTQILRYRTMTSSFGFRGTFIEEHRAILNALTNRDREQAEKLMKQHILDDLNTILHNLKKEDRIR